MKRTIIILLIFCNFFLFSSQEINRFEASEQGENESSTITENNAGDQQVAKAAPSGPGNPDGDDDLPLDKNLPVLLLIGIAIIAATTQKKSLSSFKL